jgi:chromosome segregation ATPase
MATLEPGNDSDKKIHQRHFQMAMEEVIAAKKVMEQTLFEDGDGSSSVTALAGMSNEWNRLSRSQETIENEVQNLLERMGENEQRVAALPGIVERFDDAARAAQLQMRAELLEHLEALAKQNVETSQSLNSLREALRAHETKREELQSELQALNQTIVSEQAGVLQAQSEFEAKWKYRFDRILLLIVLLSLVTVASLFLARM